MPLAFCLFEVRLSEIRDQVRGPKARRPEGPNALDFVKRIGLVRPEMALDRAPRGLTRRCRRRFHFFVATRSTLRVFVFSARTRIRTQLLFRPSLLGGVSCVYSRCSARDSTDSRLTDSATDTYTARGGVSKIGPNGHMETRRQLPVCRVAPSVTGRQRGASIRGRANGSRSLS